MKSSALGQRRPLDLIRRKQSLRGRVVPSTINIDSIRKRQAMTLVTKDTGIFELQFDGLQPYQLESFEPFINRLCIVEGTIEGVLFTVQNIKTVAAPKRALSLVYGKPCDLCKASTHNLMKDWCCRCGASF
ncbi:MAG: hypothetical protein K2X29_01020 [Candidatus Obscuribacterales bacterium]|nr:hypothetical protein [Candidatus Obscuribacterales bacterium]